MLGLSTGAALIAEERAEQVNCHGFNIDHDRKNNRLYQLAIGARSLISVNPPVRETCPLGWDNKLWDKMIEKPYKERLIIAGALIAAEIDRIGDDDEI